MIVVELDKRYVDFIVDMLERVHNAEVHSDEVRLSRKEADNLIEVLEVFQNSVHQDELRF